MKGKESKIAFISFYLLFRIGTFQWVMAKKGKNLTWPQLAWRVVSGASFHPFLVRGAPGGLAHYPVNMKTLAHWSDYRKAIRGFHFGTDNSIKSGAVGMGRGSSQNSRSMRFAEVSSMMKR
jgi:hypothetical protein